MNGRGGVTGVSLVSHPGIDMVGFTGGSATGRAIMAAAGAHLKPCILELGGKSASIVFADADIEQALDGTLFGIYFNNGQQCLAGSRILVHRSIAESFMARFTARAKAMECVSAHECRGCLRSSRSTLSLAIFSPKLAQ